MDSKLQSNAVLSGYIHSYCLVCETYFDSAEDITEHIGGTEHAETLAAHPYLEKYGDNHIRKVTKGYYCEFCSVLLATAAKVTLHVQDRAHFDKKGSFLLRRPSGQAAVTAFDDLLINERAWHRVVNIPQKKYHIRKTYVLGYCGPQACRFPHDVFLHRLSEDTCAVCNEEFDNENIHKSDSGHLLKLLQVRVEFAPGNNLYRKTDDSSFQCLTCNSVFVLNTLNDHFANMEHKNLYSKCQEEYKKYMEQCKSKVVEKATKSDAKETKHKTNEAKSEKSDEIQKIETKSAKNNATSISKNDLKTQKENKTTKPETKFEKKVETIDTKNHKNNTEFEVSVEDFADGQMVVAKISKTSSEDDEAAKYAKENNLTYNPGNTNAFCRVCESKLPSPLRSMMEHVNGKEHKSRVLRVNQTSAATNNKPRITKMASCKLIDESVHIHNMFHEDVVINEKYCVPAASFVMITEQGNRFRCQACEETFYEDDIGEHTSSWRHERAMRDTPVITCLHASEFCREVRPNIYHCGYCNLVIPRWEDVARHMQSREHKDNKDGCQWRLQRYLPELAERRSQELFHKLVLGQMFRR